MSTVNRPGTESFSINPGDLDELLRGKLGSDKAGPETQEIQTPVAGQEMKTPEGELDAFGNTLIFNNGNQETVVENTAAQTQQSFADRLRILCRAKPSEAEAFLEALRENNMEEAERGVLIHLAMQFLYRDHPDLIPELEPYFDNPEVMDSIFYGEGILASHLGRGGNGRADSVRMPDNSHEVWKIGKKPTKSFDKAHTRWYSRDEDKSSIEWFDRFNREVAAMRALGPLGISVEAKEGGIFESTTGEPLPFVSLKQIPGISLDKLVRSGEIPQKVVFDILVLVSKLLSDAHSNQAYHRDVKPENILIGDDGTVYILDWGMVTTGKVTHALDAFVTAPGQVFGTPAYMAPEVAKGHTVDANAKTDVYALGVMMYEMLTGKTPYSGGGKEMMYQHVTALVDPKPLEDKRVPPKVIKLIMQSLEKDGAKRPSAFEFSSALFEHSSLYVQHGKPSFHDFIESETFKKFGKLNLPATKNDELNQMPSRFATVRKEKDTNPDGTPTVVQQKTYDDFTNERREVGREMVNELSSRVAGVIRRETRNKILKWAGGLSAAAALIIGAASLKSDSVSSERQKDTVTDVVPDPNAPIKELFDNLEIIRTPDGAKVVTKLFSGLPCELTLTDADVVALPDESGATRAIVWKPNGEQCLKLLGYGDPKDFPEFDEFKNLPKTGLENYCITYVDPATGQSLTYFHDFASEIVIEENGTGKVYSHRNDLAAAAGPQFELGDDFYQNRTAHQILKSLPPSLKPATNPNSPAPGGGLFNRSHAANEVHVWANALRAEFDRRQQQTDAVSTASN